MGKGIKLAIAATVFGVTGVLLGNIVNNWYYLFIVPLCLWFGVVSYAIYLILADLKGDSSRYQSSWVSKLGPK